MKINILKLKIFFIFMLIFCAANFYCAFASTYKWEHDDKKDVWKAYDKYDGLIKNKIICDDIDGDGIAYYYYMDADGNMLIDTICPDYYIVDDMGRRLDKTGELMYKDIGVKGDFNSTTNGNAIAGLQNQLADTGANNSMYGAKSERTISQVDANDVYGPQLNIQVESNDGHSKSILGIGAVLKEQEENVFDSSIDTTVINYIKSGNQYSKKVNGKTYSGATWEGVTALKGTGAYIDVENPNNNFNKLSGRISTQYINGSTSQKNDRTTKCMLSVTNEDMDELYYTDSFNYTNSYRFSFIFPKKTKILRIELTVDGEYNTRTVYLRDLTYGFNKKAWKEEKEEDEEEGYNPLSVMQDNITPDETEWEDPDEDLDDEVEDKEDADDDEKDDKEVDPEDLKPNDNDKTSGPTFDTDLQERAKKNAVYGPAFPENTTQ